VQELVLITTRTAVEDDTEVPGELEWQERALCAQTDPEAFFPEKGGSTREAKRVCMSCEVRVQCLDYALENDERLWSAGEIVATASALGVPAIVDAFHDLNPGGLTLHEALDRSLPTWSNRPGCPKLHLSSQDPAKQPGAHAYGIDATDWQALLEALDGHDVDVDVMIEAKGKEQAVLPLLGELASG
jgi:UV DNA damage repair endonuclease